jgi:hypothetical protein
MSIVAMALTIAGLCLFETICSVNNAIINAEVLSTMSLRARRWFLFWGLLFAVFVVRGTLPWFIVWMTTPGIGPIDAFMSTLSPNLHVREAMDRSAPMLLMGGGTFLIFLFFHWLFLQPKSFGLRGEQFFNEHGGWFYAAASVLLTVIVWYSLKVGPMVAFAAVVGSTTFFITHGFKQHAEESESRLMQKNISDVSKILYLEVIDSAFSIDGVLGAFAFTLSVPLILLGNGLGAVVVRQITVSNIERIKRYRYLDNGAMYSTFVLGAIMVLDAFGIHIPSWISPVATFAIVGWFYLKSHIEIKNSKVI